MAVLFSFIVPVYNVEQFLPRCLDSICRQACTDYEVLLIDDGSTDGSGQICDDYASRYEQCKVIHKKNSGASDSRNVGLSIASGKYIVFLDSDDYIEKEMLAKVYEQMQVQDFDICSFGARRVDEENHFLYEFRFDDMTKPFTFDEESRDMFLWQYFLQYKVGWEAWVHVFRRDVIEAHQIRFDVELKLAEDLLFTFEYLLYAKKLVKLPDLLYDYTLRKDSITKVIDYNREIEIIFDDMFEKMKDILRKKDAERYSAKRISIFYAMLLYYFRTKYRKEISPSEFRYVLHGLKNSDTQKNMLRMLLKQKKTLQQVLGNNEGEKLYYFAEYLLSGNVAKYEKKCAKWH